MVVKQYKCDQCGKIAQWGDGWASRIYCFGHGIDAWEEDIHSCSDECREKWDRETKGMKRRDLMAHIRSRQAMNKE